MKQTLTKREAKIKKCKIHGIYFINGCGLCDLVNAPKEPEREEPIKKIRN